MISKFFQTMKWALAMLTAMVSVDAYAQTIGCQPYTTSVTPNGVVVVTAQNLDANSNVPNGYNLAIMYSGALQSAVTLTCNSLNFSPMLGQAQVPMTLALLNPNGQVVDTCSTTVYIFDTSGVCGGSTSGCTPMDTVIVDASDCNTCNGEYTFYLMDGAGNICNAGPYTSTVNGVSTTSNIAVFSASGLCAGTYTVNIVDGNGYQYTHTIVIGCNGGGGGNPTVTCNSTLTLDLAPNGYVMLSAQDIVTSSNNAGYLYLSSSNSASGWNGVITFGCNDIGTHTVVAYAGGSSPNTLAAACSTQVTITDTTNVCGGQGGNVNFMDSLANSSDCNTCDGEALVTGFLDANGNYVAVNTVIWMDGVTGNFRNDLCPFTPYTYTAFDANQNAYTHTVMVGCNGGGTPSGACIDTTLIDSMAFVTCPTIYAPVCGCNGITYSNDCEAQSNGVTSWTSGPCNNSGTGNLFINVSTGNTGCDPNACTGYAMLTVSGINGALAGPCSYFWDNGGTGAVQQGLCAGVYTVDVIEANTGNWQLVTVIIGTNQGCVWPGDTDDNTAVNNFDILPIALAYGESGPARPNATLGWYSQASPDWNTANPIANMPNYKHIDCNGDGLIDLNDIDGVSQNYGQSYYRSSSSMPFGAPLYVSSGTANEGDRIGLPIILGDATNIAQDVYGLAFTIHYDPTMVVASSIDIDFANSWLGSDLLTFVKDFPALGLVEVAVARKDRQNITNFGEIGVLNLTISDDILRTSATETMPISISTVRIINNANTKQGASVQTGVVTIELTSSIDDVVADDFKVNVFPNPAREVLNISTENTWIEDLELRTVTGQLVEQQLNVAANAATVNVANLPSGVYFVSVKTDKGMSRQRIVVNR